MHCLVIAPQGHWQQTQGGCLGLYKCKTMTNWSSLKAQMKLFCMACFHCWGWCTRTPQLPLINKLYFEKLERVMQLVLRVQKCGPQDVSKLKWQGHMHSQHVIISSETVWSNVQVHTYPLESSRFAFIQLRVNSQCIRITPVDKYY